MKQVNVSNVFIKIGDIPTEAKTSKNVYNSILEEIVGTLGYTILKKVSHKFKPHGMTSLLLLSESHISIHTWPEYNFAVCEMVTCKKFTSREASTIVKILKNRLGTKNITIQIIK